jgi:hypothetical protein
MPGLCSRRMLLISIIWSWATPTWVLNYWIRH